MDPQQYTPTPQPNTTPVPQAMLSEKKSSPVGSIIGTVIVIIILIFGGLYFWGAQLEKEQAQNDQLPFIPAEQSNDTASADTSLDQVADIEADLQTSDPSMFESDTSADMKSIENQL